MKKVLLMCLQGVPYETSPARYQLVQALKENGYETFVFNYGRIKSWEDRRGIDHYVNLFKLSPKEIRNKIKNIMPEYIIVSTDDDIRILFPILPLLKKTTFIYYNLEIFTPQREQRLHRNKSKWLYSVSWRSGYLWNKAKEMIFTKKCKFFVIQDELRKRVANKYFISHKNTILIPNSYVFDPKEIIGPEAAGVIYSGILARFRMEPLMEQLWNMPNFPLVFSGQSDAWSREQFQKLQDTHPDIKFYEQSLSLQEHLAFIKQYAVGFVWYDHSQDENEEYIGLASGKFFRHLSIGQPVIVSSSPGIGSIVKKYKLGIVIDDISRLKEAYDEIMKNYSYYQNNIKRVYAKKFNFTKNIDAFLKGMEK